MRRPGPYGPAGGDLRPLYPPGHHRDDGGDITGRARPQRRRAGAGKVPWMKAQVGDRLIASGAESHRVCEIIRLPHRDGSPPYVVRWLSDGHIALVFPGPYTRLVRCASGKQTGEKPLSARGVIT